MHLTLIASTSKLGLGFSNVLVIGGLRVVRMMNCRRPNRSIACRLRGGCTMTSEDFLVEDKFALAASRLSTSSLAYRLAKGVTADDTNKLC